MMARTSIWGSSLRLVVVNRLVITSGSIKGTDLFFCAGEFLMASNEALCRMQLARIRLLLCVDEYFFLGMVDFDLRPTQFPNWCSS